VTAMSIIHSYEVADFVQACAFDHLAVNLRSTLANWG
jgi:hypothetical protein